MLFELCNAVLYSPPLVGSVPILSVKPDFRHFHSSHYEALDHGRVNGDPRRGFLVEHRSPDTGCPSAPYFVARALASES